MKKLALGIIAAVGLSTAAQAADMAVKAPPVVAPVALYNWSGFYVAGTVGGGWARVRGDFVDPTLPPDKHNADRSDGWVDGHVGWQWQWNKLVVGIEGTYAAPFSSDFGVSRSPSADCFGASLIANRNCESRISDVWSVGGRLGFAAWERLLLYGTGGYASARIETRDRVTNTGLINVAEFDTYRHGGWYAGAGADWFVTKVSFVDLILGIEYRHYEFDTVRHFPSNVTFVPPIRFPGDVRDVRGSLDTISARLTLKWNPQAAVVAKY